MLKCWTAWYFCVGGTVVSGGEKNELWKHCLSWANSLWMCWLRMEQWLKCVVVSSSPSVSLCSSRISSTFSDPSAGEDHSDWWCHDSDMWGHPVAWTQSSPFGSHLEISTGRRVGAGTCLMEPAAMIRPVISQGSKSRLKAGIWHWPVVFQHVFPYQSHFFLKKRWSDLTCPLGHRESWAGLSTCSSDDLPLPIPTTVDLCSSARRKARTKFPAEGMSARCRLLLLQGRKSKFNCPGTFCV